MCFEHKMLFDSEMEFRSRREFAIKPATPMTVPPKARTAASGAKRSFISKQPLVTDKAESLSFRNQAQQRSAAFARTMASPSLSSGLSFRYTRATSLGVKADDACCSGYLWY